MSFADQPGRQARARARALGFGQAPRAVQRAFELATWQVDGDGEPVVSPSLLVTLLEVAYFAGRSDEAAEPSDRAALARRVWLPPEQQPEEPPEETAPDVGRVAGRDTPEPGAGSAAMGVPS